MPPVDIARMGLRFVTGVFATGLAALALAGCGGTRPAVPTASDGRVLHVVERDFQIKLPSAVRAGEVTSAVHNEGPDQHELIVVRLSKAPLPLRRDGIT